MSAEQNSKQNELVPSSARGLITQSANLAKRGLALAVTLQERIVHFPRDRSMGDLYSYSNGQDLYSFPYAGDAKGDIVVAPGHVLHLLVSDEASADLSPLADLAPDDLWDLDLMATSVTDNQLRHIQGLTGLSGLNLAVTQIGDEGLRYLKPLKNLRYLNLHRTRITDSGLKYIEHLRGMESLLLSFTYITDIGIEYIQNMTELRGLYLEETRITDTSVPYIQRFKQLFSLNLKGTGITQEGWKKLINALPKLRLEYCHSP